MSTKKPDCGCGKAQIEPVKSPSQTARFAKAIFQNPLEPTLTGHTLPFATGGVFQLPKHITKETQGYEPTPKPSPELGILPKALLSEAARLDAIQRHWQGFHFQEGSGEGESGKDEEQEEGDKVEPPEAPKDLPNTLKKKIEELTEIREKEGWVLAKGDGNADDAMPPEKADPKKEELIPAFADGKCRKRSREKYIKDSLQHAFVLWEHDYGSFIRKISGADTSIADTDKEDKLTSRCDKDAGPVRRAVTPQISGLDYKRAIRSLEEDLKENGFPKSWIWDKVEWWVTGVKCQEPCIKAVDLTFSDSKVEVEDTNTGCWLVPVGDPYTAEAVDKKGDVVYQRDEKGNRVPALSLLQEYKVVLRISVEIMISYAVYAKVTCNDA